MNDNKKNTSNQDFQDHISVEHKNTPRWKQVHHSWLFWFFLVLMLIGIIYYISSVSFAFA